MNKLKSLCYVLAFIFSAASNANVTTLKWDGYISIENRANAALGFDVIGMPFTVEAVFNSDAFFFVGGGPNLYSGVGPTYMTVMLGNNYLVNHANAGVLNVYVQDHSVQVHQQFGGAAVNWPNQFLYDLLTVSYHSEDVAKPSLINAPGIPLSKILLPGVYSTRQGGVDSLMGLFVNQPDIYNLAGFEIYGNGMVQHLTVAIDAVPEPSSSMLGALGIFSLVFYRKKSDILALYRAK